MVATTGYGRNRNLRGEMRILKQKVELIDLYHHQMKEFDNLKMGYAFMKAKLLIYQ
jgi:hypothetical protein